MAKLKAPEGETTEQRFIREAGLRVSNLVTALEVLGNMGASVPDESYQTQAFSVIDAAVARAKASWTEKRTASKRRVFAFSPPDVRQEPLPHTSATPQKAAAKR